MIVGQCSWLPTSAEVPPAAVRSPRAGRVGWASIAPMTYTLILLRHGESEWNAKNLFTGWVDVDLTEKGMAEAWRGGELLAEAGLLPDIVHHHTLTVDLMGLLKPYQARYYGAMYSGCGGGYIYVVSDEPVPGGFQVKVRTE